MTLQELQEKRKEKCFGCSVYWLRIGFMQEAFREDMIMRRCKKGECIFEERGKNMVNKRFNDWELSTIWVCPECKKEQRRMTNYCPDCGRQLIYEKEVEEES